MSDEVRTTVQDFNTDDEVRNLFPLEKNDTIWGVYNSHIFQVAYKPSKYEEYDTLLGTYSIEVFGQKEDIESPRGSVLYSEKHSEPDSHTPVLDLFRRARKAAVRIATDDDVHVCNYCNWLVSGGKITVSIPILTRNVRTRRIPTFDDDTSCCIGLSSYIPPKVEIYKHKDDENPLFSQDELEECTSLIQAPGYPEWKYNSKLEPYENFRLHTFLEEHPEVFADDVDVETVELLLDHFNTTERNSDDVVDRTKLTKNRE